MWMWTPPSSTIRRASAPYSSGVYGIAGHWSRLAMAPLIAQVITTGSSRLTCVLRGGWRSHRHHSGAFPRALDPLAGGHLERPADCRARLSRIDHVVDHVVPGRDVHVDDLTEAVDQLAFLGLGVLGLLHLLAKDDLDRALRPHHADLGRRTGDDHVGLVGPAAHDVVAGAVGLAQHDGDLRHGGVGRRVEHLGPVPDDPRLFDLGADHEPGYVHQIDEREPV